MSTMNNQPDENASRLTTYIRQGLARWYTAHCFACEHTCEIHLANALGLQPEGYASVYECDECHHQYPFADAPLPDWTDIEIQMTFEEAMADALIGFHEGLRPPPSADDASYASHMGAEVYYDRLSQWFYGSEEEKDKEAL